MAISNVSKLQPKGRDAGSHRRRAPCRRWEHNASLGADRPAMNVLMSICDYKHQRKITSQVFVSHEDEFSASIARDSAAQN